jgi:hypothetical protein
MASAKVLRLKGIVIAGLTLAGCLSGCGALRDGAVRPSVNDCVAAIPVAQTLVGKRAELVQLRRLSLPDTQALLTRLGSSKLSRADAARPGAAAPHPGTAAPQPLVTARPSGSPDDGPRPCVLVFSGSFTTASLAVAPGISGAPTGRFVVLVTTTRHPRVLRTVITTKDPVT